MRSIQVVTLALAASLCATSQVAAQDAVETREYSRRGELSPGTQAPTRAQLLAAIEHGSPEKLKSTLEYAERVYCEECVPLLEKKLLDSPNARVRELSAWWLRRQPFAAPVLLKGLRKVVREDADATRRARAAEALGEFMDPHAVPDLSDAALSDKDVKVRVAAVRALGRLNSEVGFATLTDTLADKSAEVKLATLQQLTSFGGFRDYSVLIGLLGDASADVRTSAARLCGEYRVRDAEAPLIAMLSGDDSEKARKAAAWALGRVGGEEGHVALSDASDSETSQGVLDAIRIARRMPVRF